ncbi:MAG: rRNA maturation RNase YbeY [Bacillota bacterium]|nr:rRNA maturation RNase YbeY [Bacillota bacterium]
MILINNEQDKISYDRDLEDTLEKIINFTLEEQQVKIPCEISLTFVDNDGIKELNKNYRGIENETDVLSFPMLEYPEGEYYKDVYSDNVFKDEFKDGDDLVLGDIVISLEKAEDQSKEYNHPFIREVCYLTVHSMLHLLGYDHMEDEMKKVMREEEEKILSAFNLRR